MQKDKKNQQNKDFKKEGKKDHFETKKDKKCFLT